MKQELQFLVAGHPVPWHRPPQYRTRKGNRVFRGKHKADSAQQKRIFLACVDAMHAWRAAARKPWDAGGEWRVDMTHWLGTLRSQPDKDNLDKQVHDALQGTCYDNDKQVVAGYTEIRLDRGNPRVEVFIQRVTGFLR